MKLFTNLFPGLSCSHKGKKETAHHALPYSMACVVLRRCMWYDPRCCSSGRGRSTSWREALVRYIWELCAGTSMMAAPRSVSSPTTTSVPPAPPPRSASRPLRVQEAAAPRTTPKHASPDCRLASGRFCHLPCHLLRMRCVCSLGTDNCAGVQHALHR